MSPSILFAVIETASSRSLVGQRDRHAPKSNQKNNQELGNHVNQFNVYPRSGIPSLSVERRFHPKSSNEKGAET
jgi:hypothetical protein